MTSQEDDECASALGAGSGFAALDDRFHAPRVDLPEQFQIPHVLAQSGGAGVAKMNCDIEVTHRLIGVPPALSLLIRAEQTSFQCLDQGQAVQVLGVLDPLLLAVLTVELLKDLPGLLQRFARSGHVLAEMIERQAEMAAGQIASVAGAG